MILEATDHSSDHLALYGEMDVALDPFPYGGATTSCEALIMGVPVITMAGEGMAGRLTSSILASADCEEWIAADQDAYVALAQRLAAAGQGIESCVRNYDEKCKRPHSAMGNGCAVNWSGSTARPTEPKPLREG